MNIKLFVSAIPSLSTYSQTFRDFPHLVNLKTVLKSLPSTAREEVDYMLSLLSPLFWRKMNRKWERKEKEMDVNPENDIPLLLPKDLGELKVIFWITYNGAIFYRQVNVWWGEGLGFCCTALISDTCCRELFKVGRVLNVAHASHMVSKYRS